ncbi:hypothetical protein GA0115246_106565 [Streptomyces sp. SolWspMP-sol7th]|nr:hypothetical protein GA0115246_106565 [Streptomyces sp. SolWspMP-sol7th]
MRAARHAKTVSMPPVKERAAPGTVVEGSWPRAAAPSSPVRRVRSTPLRAAPAAPPSVWKKRAAVVVTPRSPAGAESCAYWTSWPTRSPKPQPRTKSAPRVAHADVCAVEVASRARPSAAPEVPRARGRRARWFTYRCESTPETVMPAAMGSRKSPALAESRPRATWR